MDTAVDTTDTPTPVSLSVTQAAQRAGVSTKTVRCWLTSGRLERQAERIGFLESELASVQAHRLALQAPVQPTMPEIALERPQTPPYQNRPTGVRTQTSMVALLLNAWRGACALADLTICARRGREKRRPPGQRIAIRDAEALALRSIHAAASPNTAVSMRRAPSTRLGTRDGEPQLPPADRGLARVDQDATSLVASVKGSALPASPSGPLTATPRSEDAGAWFWLSPKLSIDRTTSAAPSP
jgi:hypothetical protein